MFTSWKKEKNKKSASPLWLWRKHTGQAEALKTSGTSGKASQLIKKARLDPPDVPLFNIRQTSPHPATGEDMTRSPESPDCLIRAAELGGKIFAKFEEGRRIAIAAARAKQHKHMQTILPHLQKDLAKGRPTRGRAHRIYERLLLTEPPENVVSERTVRRILARLLRMSHSAGVQHGITLNGGCYDHDQ